MSVTQRRIFSVIYWRIVLGEPPPTLRELAADLGFSEKTMSWTQECVTQLERKGYIVRGPAYAARVIGLTELGRRTMPTVSIDLGTAHAIAETFTKRAK